MYQAKTIALAAIKGGSGKTTSAAALIHAGAADGLHVLAIDLDPQANLSYILRADTTAGICAADVIQYGVEARQCLQNAAPNIDVLAANSDLSEIKSGRGSAYRLARALLPIQSNYDLIIIDTPPQYGEIVTNALAAATDLLIPVTTDTGSIQGMYKIIETAQYVQDAANNSLRLAGVFITNYDGRPKINRHLAGMIQDAAAAAGIPFLSEIRRGCAVPEAAAFRASLFDYAPRSKQAADYADLYKKVVGSK